MAHEFKRRETPRALGGVSVIYEQDVQWLPKPTITADAFGVTLTGMHAVSSRDAMNTVMATMEAAWSDHLVLKMQDEIAKRPVAEKSPSSDDSYFPTPAGGLALVGESGGEFVLPLAHGKTRSEQGGSSV